MKPDVLERLLLDRALGRLEPDVDTLLADYLDDDASAASQARELQEVVHLAKEAVRQRVLAIEPPPQFQRLIWRHRAERVLALAASFVIGVGITALALRAKRAHGSLSPRAASADKTPGWVFPIGHRELPDRATLGSGRKAR